MTLLEMKIKVLGLIEELNPESECQTDDLEAAAGIGNRYLAGEQKKY